MKGIDISRHNDDFVFDFVVIRAGCGKTPDADFEKNYKWAKSHGFAVGAYWYFTAKTEDAAMEQTKMFLQQLHGKQFEMPVFADIEEQYSQYIEKLGRPILETLERNGYFAGVYSSESVFLQYTSETFRQRFCCWVAKWSKNAPKIRADIWQYGTTNNTLDRDICEKDYPGIIKNAKLNGWGVT